MCRIKRDPGSHVERYGPLPLDENVYSCIKHNCTILIAHLSCPCHGSIVAEHHDILWYDMRWHNLIIILHNTIWYENDVMMMRLWHHYHMPTSLFTPPIFFAPPYVTCWPHLTSLFRPMYLSSLFSPHCLTLQPAQHQLQTTVTNFSAHLATLFGPLFSSLETWGVGLLSQFPPFCYIPNFSASPKYRQPPPPPP